MLWHNKFWLSEFYEPFQIFVSDKKKKVLMKIYMTKYKNQA